MLVVFAAGATVAIGVPESELDRVLMVTEFVPCEAFWLIEGRRGHEGTTDEPPSHEEGIHDADVSVPDIWDPGEVILYDSDTRIPFAHFEDDDTSLPKTSKCACRISSCKCEASRYASLICTCDGGAKK